jgi:hypothetical protein
MNGRSKITDHTKDGRDHRVVCKHYHSVIEAAFNGARTPQTATAKHLWNGAGKTELTFTGISEIAGDTVSLRLPVGAIICPPNRFRGCCTVDIFGGGNFW